MFIDLLKKNNFFSHFNENELKDILSSNIITIKKYSKGDTVHCQGEACIRMDILLCGSLVAYNLLENGSELSIFNFSPNSAIGCNLIYSNINKYPLNIYCTSDSEIAYINKDAITRLLESNPSFTMEFIKAISNHSINLNTKMLSFSNKTLRDRILTFINTEVSIQESNKIKLNISKKQLADELGVQRPSLFRELKKMRDENIIDYDTNYITLLN